MAKPSKDPSHHGRGKHRGKAGCDTGRKQHETKQLAEKADENGKAERCDRCRKWHAKSDRPRSRRYR